MLEVVLRLQPAAGIEGVGDADSSGAFELYSDIELIILFQETSVNGVEDVVLVVVPVVLGQLSGDLPQLGGEAGPAGDAETVLQRCRHGVLLLRAVLPEVGAAGILLCAGV